MNGPQSLPERILLAGLAQRGLDPNATEREIREFFKNDWNNILQLTIFAEHATGLLRDVLTRRIKFLDLKGQAVRLLIIGAILALIGFFAGWFK